MQNIDVYFYLKNSLEMFIVFTFCQGQFINQGFEALLEKYKFVQLGY